MNQPSPERVVRAKWALRATFFFMGMAVAATTARFAEIKHGTGVSQATFGAALLVGNFGALIANYIAGGLARRYGTRSLSRMAITGIAISQMMYGFTTHLWQVPIAAFLAGSAYAFANVAANSQGSMIQQDLGRSLMPSFHGAWSVGALFASTIAGLIAKSFTPGQHILVNSLIALAGAYAVNRALLPHEVDHLDQSSETAVAHDQPIPGPTKRFITILAIASMFSNIAEVSVGDWSTILLREDFNIAIGANTLGYTSFILIQTIGRFSVGKLIDKHSIQTIMRNFSIIGGVAYISGLFLALRIHEGHPLATLITLCLMYALLGLGLAPIAPSFASLAGAIPTVATARAVARMQLIAATTMIGARGAISLLVNFLGLPIALMIPACALIASGLIAYRLHPESL